MEPWSCEAVRIIMNEFGLESALDMNQWGGINESSREMPSESLLVSLRYDYFIFSFLNAE